MENMKLKRQQSINNWKSGCSSELMYVGSSVANKIGRMVIHIFLPLNFPFMVPYSWYREKGSENDEGVIKYL